FAALSRTWCCCFHICYSLRPSPYGYIQQSMRCRKVISHAMVLICRFLETSGGRVLRCSPSFYCLPCGRFGVRRRGAEIFQTLASGCDSSEFWLLPSSSLVFANCSRCCWAECLNSPLALRLPLVA